MRPSGRTGTARVRVSFFQTMIWRTSSGPMMYVEGSTALAAFGLAVSAPTWLARRTSNSAQATVSAFILPPSRDVVAAYGLVGAPRSVSACRGTVGERGRTQQYLGG